MNPLSPATAALLTPIRLADQDRLELSIDKTLHKFRAKVVAVKHEAGYNQLPSYDARTRWQSRIPERKILTGQDVWELAATAYTAEVINAVWPLNRILWHDKQTQIVFTELLTSSYLQGKVAETYARFKTLQEIPLHTYELHSDPALRLRPDQQAALWCAMHSDGYALLHEQGCGKTPITVARVCNEVARHSGDRMLRGLIVCPKNVRRNWVREFERFATRRGKVAVIRGDFMTRATQIIETIMPGTNDDGSGNEFGVCVISYEGMCKTWDVIASIDWDIGILDEAHYIKWPGSQRSEYSRKLRDKCKYRMALTGTPICNSPLDIYAILEFLGDGYSGFKDWKAFKAFYGVFIEQTDGEAGTSHQKLVAIQNKPFMQEKMAGTCFITTKKEVLPFLPPLTFDIIEAEMSKPQREAYEGLAEKLLYQIENELDSSKNKSLTINNILTQLLKLAQICAGYIVWDEIVDPKTLEVVQSKHVEYFKINPKLDELIEQLKAKSKDEKTIVWSCFVPAIRQISERLTEEGLTHVQFYGATSDADRVEAERAFNCDPEMRIFVANQAAGGTGLNLLGYPPHGGDGYTTNCDHHIFYACNWSFVQRDQAQARSHRSGTRKSVRITDLVIPATVDEDIRVRVGEKKLMAMDIGDIREILRGIVAGVGKQAVEV